MLSAVAVAFGIDFFFACFLLLVIWAMTVFFALIVAVASAFKREWCFTIGMLVLPLSFALTLWNSDEIWFRGIGMGEYIHFRLERETYLARIAALPSGKEPRTVVFVLSEDGWAGISNYHLVVYDESDEIALPEQQRSASWKGKVADTPLGYGVGYLRPLGDHFYIVRISY